MFRCINESLPYGVLVKVPELLHKQFFRIESDRVKSILPDLEIVSATLVECRVLENLYDISSSILFEIS